MPDLDVASRRTGTGRRARRLIVCASLVTLAALAAACGDKGSDNGAKSTTTAASSSQGPTTDASVMGPVKKASGTPVKVGYISEGKNAVTDQTIELDVAAATTKYLNEHKGGIGGRPIELTTCEADLDPGKATDCANQMVQDGVAAVVVGSIAETENVWKVLNEAKLPSMWFAGVGDDLLADSTNTFTLSDPTGATVAVPISVAKEHKLKKVTAIVIDVPAALAIYQGSGEKEFKDAGIALNLVRVPPGTADMTAQLQPVLADNPGVVHVLGNDSFCIAAFQGMKALGYNGPRTSITQCITDATRTALANGELKGIVVSSSSPVGANDSTDELYRTVMKTYGNNIDTSRAAGHGAFTALAALGAATENMTGDINPTTITAAIKAMPEQDLPDGGGLKMQCNGKQVPNMPAVCVSGTLVTTLDEKGLPTKYKVAQS
jgi:branched-chain amino acid transport system substrate-binding protein